MLDAKMVLIIHLFINIYIHIYSHCSGILSNCIVRFKMWMIACRQFDLAMLRFYPVIDRWPAVTLSSALFTRIEIRKFILTGVFHAWLKCVEEAASCCRHGTYELGIWRVLWAQHCWKSNWTGKTGKVF